MNAEFCHLQNKLIELQNKLSLSDHYKNRLKSDIRSITLPENIELKNTKIIVIENFINLIYFILHVNLFHGCKHQGKVGN